MHNAFFIYKFTQTKQNFFRTLNNIFLNIIYSFIGVVQYRTQNFLEGVLTDQELFVKILLTFNNSAWLLCILVFVQDQRGLVVWTPRTPLLQVWWWTWTTERREREVGEGYPVWEQKLAGRKEVKGGRCSKGTTLSTSSSLINRNLGYCERTFVHGYQFSWISWAL